MNKTQLKITINVVILAATTATLFWIWRTPPEPQQDFTYRATVEEDKKRELASLTIAINQQIAIFKDKKRTLEQEIGYAKEQKDSLRVQDVPLSFH